MITTDGFSAGLVILKAAFNLKDFPVDTTGVWFTLLEESDVDDEMFLRAIKRVSTYEENWFTVGTNFVGKIMKAVVNIREENKEAARYNNQKTPQLRARDPMDGNPEFDQAMRDLAESRFGVDDAKAKRALETMDRLNKEVEGK